MTPRKNRIVKTLAAVAIFSLFIVWHSRWRKTDVDFAFHCAAAPTPPVALQLTFKDSSGAEVLSFQKQIAFPQAPTLSAKLRPGRYALAGNCADAKGNKTRFEKSVEIPKDSAKIDIYF